MVLIQTTVVLFLKDAFVVGLLNKEAVTFEHGSKPFSSRNFHSETLLLEL